MLVLAVLVGVFSSGQQFASNHFPEGSYSRGVVDFRIFFVAGAILCCRRVVGPTHEASQHSNPDSFFCLCLASIKIAHSRTDLHRDMAK